MLAAVVLVFDPAREIAIEGVDACEVERAGKKAHAHGAKEALDENAQRPLSAPLYLKTPKVFGFNGIFRRLATRSNIHAVLDHHDRIQKGKPPDGKRSWIERDCNESALVRPGYGLTEMGFRPPYVHDYRTATVSRFLVDVGAIN